MIFPWHFEEDRLLNESTSGEAIGTTHARHRALLSRQGRPFARHPAGRHVSRELRQPHRADRRGEAADPHGPGLPGEQFPPGREEIFQQYRGYAERLRPYVGDTTAYLLDAIEAGKKMLFEGAQGALLDIDHGTFPFVTSSNSSGVGVSSGSGVPGRHVTKVLGIVKAYCTRVGGGPFPTEQDNAIGQHIRDRGHEYGTVTRRPRRCGWFDVVAARYTARLSGVDSLAVMLLDVSASCRNCRSARPTSSTASGSRIFRPRRGPAARGAGLRNDARLAGGDQPRAPHCRLAPAGPRLSRSAQRPGGPAVEVVSVGPDRQQTIFASDVRQCRRADHVRRSTRQ